MFKGLRTKIESEQKGQIDPKPKRQEKGTPRVKIGYQISELHDQISPDISHKFETNPNLEHDQGKEVRQSSTAAHISQDELQKSKISDHTISQNSSQSNRSAASELAAEQSTRNFSANKEVEGTIDELVCQVVDLRDQLKTVIKERDEINRKREQSYQLIEILESNLEEHKATNTSLENKLAQFELRLNGQKTETSDKTRSNGSSINDNVISKSFNPKCHFANASDTRISDNVEVLRHEIIELQAQLAKKNRQLKIRQQNLIDMKKALQKEILDHGRTRDELSKVEKQLKNFEARTTTHHDSTTDQPISGDSKLADQPSDPGLKKDNQQFENASEQKYVDNGQGTLSSQTGNISEDTVSLNAATGAATVQFDRISYLSRSSASVDDFESNDLQHSNNNNNNKELSHEYLRNVLFRYMTSTDTETTQHLVKAISVLMDFTPEQLAAIKDSMNGRMSSWLRLK